MVTNFRHDRLLKEKRQKVYGALLIILVISVFGRGPIFSFMGRLSHFIGIPIWSISNSIRDSEEYLTELAKPKSVIVSDLLTLRGKMKGYENEQAIIEALKIENRNIKAELNRKTNESTVLARVLSRPPFQIYDTLIIDVGSRDGMTVGSLAFASNNYMLGIITRVYENTSVVTLSSSPKETHQVMIAGYNNEDNSSSSMEHNIVFTGIGGGGFHAQIPKHLNITKNTPMVLSSIETEVIGVITGENIGETGSLKDVYGSIPFSINSIDWVSIQIKEVQVEPNEN